MMKRRAMFTAAAMVVATAWGGSTGAGAAVARPTRRRTDRDAAPADCGPAWTSVPTPGGGYLEGVAASSSTSAWAVGYVLSSPNATVVQHWDGAAWSTVDAPSPAGGRLLAVTTIGTKTEWAVGLLVTPHFTQKTLVERGTAKGWKVVKSPSLDKDDALGAVAGTGPDDVWAVGGRSVGKRGSALIEHYDGSAWTVADTSTLTGAIVLTGVRAISPTDAWAVGSVAGADDRTLTVAVHWDGTAWTRVATPDASNLLDQLVAIGGSASNDLWAVGDTVQSISGSEITTLTEHWDGTKWRIVASPNPTSVEFLKGVTATSAGQDVAVGAVDEFRVPQVYTWTGSAWTVQTTPQAGSFTAVATSPGGPIWAVGERDGGEGPLIEESCP